MIRLYDCGMSILDNASKLYKDIQIRYGQLPSTQMVVSLQVEAMTTLFVYGMSEKDDALRIYTDTLIG